MRNLFFQVALLGGTSIAALTAAALPAPAQAQANPGDAECPIVSNIVTCTGNLPNGVEVPAGADRNGLTVENLTTDIVVTTYPGVDFTAGTATTTINVTDADNEIQLTASTPDTNLIEFNLSAMLATAMNNDSFSLTSDIDIFARTTCLTTCPLGVAYQAVGITVRGSGGSFDIENLGNISVDSDNDGTFSQSAGIVADVFGAELVRIRNAGDIVVHNGGGIHATSDNDLIEIVNDGTITLNQDENELVVYTGAIAVTFNSTQNYSDSFARPDVPQVTDFTYSIVNNGGIITNVADSFTFAPGIFVSHTYTEQFDIGSGDFVTGRQSGEIVNNGTIGGNFGGIFVEQNGAVTITNNGELSGAFGIDVQQLILEIPNPGSTTPITQVINSATGVIEVVNIDSFSVFPSGIEITGGIVDVENAGTIEASGEFASGVFIGGASASSVYRPMELVTFDNTGTILATGTTAAAVQVNRSHPVTSNRAPNQRTVITNSGSITAVGTDADAFYLWHGTSSADPTLADIGNLEIDLAATSVVTGGSGAGVAFRIIGGDTHTLDNAGLITATSGNAIVSGSGKETIDNSGRIEGTVSLGDDNDRIIARAGSMITGAVDGGAGDDTIAFDVAPSLSAVFGDRFGGTSSGFETLEKTGAGTLSLTDAVAARTALQGGTLVTTGALGAMGVDASGGTLLNATGALGAVNLTGSATLSPGGSAVTELELASLTLGSSSHLLFDLGTPDVVGGGDNDLITVSGNVTLDGLLDIDATPDFGIGVYRLIDYGGTLTDNGLAVGTAPNWDYDVQTSVAGQVNLVVAEATGPDLSIQFWDGGDSAPDGAIDGGAGTWNASNTNWTTADGSANAAWAGNFAVFQNAGGAVTVAGPQSITGLQFMDNGYVLDSGADGSLVLAAAETTVRVDPGVTAELAVTLEGSGALVKRDTGTLILSGENTYEGGTQVLEGVLEAGADEAFGAGGVTLDGGTLRAGGSFTLDRTLTLGAGNGTIDTGANTLTLADPLAGTGGLAKIGSGVLALTADSSGYTGTATIDAGTLSLDGDLGGALVIAEGATLVGEGSAASLDLFGTVAPGHSPGTLTIAGNVIFRDGSVYEAELAANGASDLLDIGGQAIIEGGTVAITALDPELSYADGSTIQIIDAAGGVTGTFDVLTESSAFLDFLLAYSTTGVSVTVAVVRTFPDVAATFNQLEASNALADFGGAGADALAVYNALLLLDGDTARAAFDASSGEIYPVLVASELRRGAGLADRYSARGHARMGEGWGAWLAGSAHDGRTDADGNGERYTRDGAGADGGIYYGGPEAGWAIGLGAGYDDQDAELDGRASRANGDGWHVGGFARYGTSGAGLTVTVSGAWASGEAQVAREIAFGAIGRTATAEVDLDSWALGAELRYGFALGGGWAVGPQARVVHAGAELGTFSEDGADSLDLAGGSGNDDERTRYGGGLFARWDGMRGSLDLGLAYMSGGSTPTEVGLEMAGAGGAYRVRSARGDGDAAAVTLGGEVDLGGGWSLGADLSGTFGSRERSVEGSVAIGFEF